MAKNPFEKIVSLVDRRTLFESVFKNKVISSIKLSNGDLFHFKAIGVFEDGGLLGTFQEKNQVSSAQPVTMLMRINKDRYLVQTELQPTIKGYKLNMNSHFYKFNRRDSVRIDIPEDVAMTFEIYSIGDQALRVKAKMIEMSQTGARFLFKEPLNLQKGLIVRGTFAAHKNFNTNLECQLIHNPLPNVWGVRFVNMDSVTANRIKSLNIEMQQLVFLKTK